MYQDSNSPVFPNRQADLDRKAAASDARLAQARKWANDGRRAIFNTLVSPNQVAQTFGIPAAVNTAKLQAQTEAARASGLMGTGDLAESQGIVSLGPPEVVPMAEGSTCGGEVTTTAVVQYGGMPQMAPDIVDGLYYRGAAAVEGGPARDETEPGWKEWVMDNPWLTLFLAGAGVYALKRAAK